jgi:hypothetical protein
VKERDREQQLIRQNVKDSAGNGECGDCHVPGLEGRCCNTCQDVIDAMKGKEGWDDYETVARSSEQVSVAGRILIFVSLG